MKDDGAQTGAAGDSSDQQRRMDALQRLAQERMALAPESARSQPPRPANDLQGASAPRSRRPWALVAVAGVVALALVVGTLAWLGATSHGAATGGAGQAITRMIVRLPTGAYCPSQPAWSPDARYMAVLVQSAEPGGDGWCYPYQNLVSSAAAQGLQTNGYGGPFNWNFSVLIIDTTSGAVVRRLVPPDPIAAVCKGVSECFQNTVWPVSQAWSPDGSMILLFTTYQATITGSRGQSYGQNHGALVSMRADGAGVPRTLVQYGRATIISNQILSVNLYSQPRYAWDLTTGQGHIPTCMKRPASKPFPTRPLSGSVQTPR